MSNRLVLLQQLFDLEVTLKPSIGFAKWQNYKHPDDPDFSQVVYWSAWLNGSGTVTVSYHLDSTNPDRNVKHAYIPLNGDSFRDCVFNYWSTN